MSSSLHGTPTVATATSASSVALNFPAGISVGDLLVIVFSVKAASLTSTFAAIDLPAGWTNAQSATLNVTGVTWPYGTFYRVADGTEGASVTLNCKRVDTNGATTMTQGKFTMTAYSGVDGTEAHSGASTFMNNTTSGVCASSGATAAGGAGYMVLATVHSLPSGAHGPTTAFTVPTGYTLATDAYGASVAVASAFKDVAVSTNPGSATWTSSPATDGEAGILFYFRLQTIVTPTGLAGTGQLGSVSITNGANNSVTLVGVHGTGALGSIGNEVDYGNTFVGGTPPFNVVYVQSPGLITARGLVHADVNAGVIDPIPEGFPAFQPDSFQNDAFQVIRYVRFAGVSATGAVGNVIYQASYLVTGVLGTTVLGSPTFRTDSSPPVTGVYGTGVLGVVDVPLLVYVSGLYGTGTLGTVAVHFDCIFTLPGGIYYLRPMVGHLGAPNVTYDKIFTVTGLVGTTHLGVVDPQVLYAVTGVVGTTHLGAVDPQNLYRVVGVAGTGLLGHFVAGWVQAPAVTGVYGTAALNPPTVVNHQSFNGLSVQGSGGVGQVGFQIGSDAAIEGVVGLGYVGAVRVAVDSSVDAIGLVASGALGNVTALGFPAMASTGFGYIGTVGIRVDCNVYVVGVGGESKLGLVGETRSANAHVTGVQAGGILGVVAPAHRSAFDKSNDIYVRLQ